MPTQSLCQPLARRLLALLLLASLTACGGSGGGSGDRSDDNSDNSSESDADETANSDDPLPVTSGNWYQPELAISWQWQLTGTLNSRYAASLYDIDLFDTSTSQISALQQAGHKVICYFSAGSWENWRDDADDFATATLGNNLDGWVGERWLDIRAASVLAVMANRMDLAVEKGCDGVEPDNMDGYQNTPGFALTASDQLTYNRKIANAAHERGLAVALKNDLDQIETLVDYFDFAVNEQCFEYNECDLLAPFIEQGKPVLNAEYNSRYINNSSNRTALCSDSLERQFSTLILPLDLDDSFRYSCR
ncbi:endo alpha-1,4 polygalactosaminidase [Parathalassolituus penaei]|uniref:Endo alpha-1,4 polygalactosaminidase n=1 Tax=Parathalassolituus penaei TaxID=2997323 RepID=A0A9X3EE21_9GAMM|nr:endo alpha-1,4 polygalactosaminidase [Parathalassolituus penaei]MCY0965089.1 endo alpha-1,4 polygalactosaminidase [Parathalassolituus penaei]